MEILLVLIAILIGLSAPLVYAGVIKLMKSRSLAATSIIAHYEPPFGLSPAELGYLYDTKMDNLEIWATLIHLEQRGIISLTPQPNKHGDGVIIKQLQTTAQLKIYEDYLLRWMKHSGSYLYLNAKPTDQALFMEQVQQSLVDQGYIATSNKLKIIFGCSVAISLILFYIVSNLEKYLTGQVNHFSPNDPFTYILAPCFIVFCAAYYQSAPILSVLGKKLVTKKLRVAWPIIDGYRLFIKTTSVPVLRHTANNLQDIRTNQALPYAIVLGLYPDWKKLFKSKR